MAMMEERTLELNVMSATHLKKVKTLRHQKSYVVAYIYPDQKHTSKVDEVGGLNPTWNFQLTIKCNEHLLQRHGSYLTLEIYSHGHLSEKLVGTVIVALRDLAKEPRCYGEPPPTLAFEVCRPSGNAKGVLKLSLKIGAVEKRSIEVPADQHPPRDQPPFVCTRFAVEVGFSSMAILGTIAGFTFHAQRDLLLENLPEFVDHTLGTVGLLLIETAIPVGLLFHKHHQMIHESLFMDVLELQGVNVEPASPAELQWIMEEKEIQKLQNQEAAGAPTNPRRQSRVIANLSATLIDPETMNSYPKVKYFLTLPLNFIPIVGQALFCWLNAMETATVLHHHYYANLKGLSREDEATVIHSRKAQYIEFGIVASLLTLLPGLNVILVLTNAIGAALWVADIEKALHSQE